MSNFIVNAAKDLKIVMGRRAMVFAFDADENGWRLMTFESEIEIDDLDRNYRGKATLKWEMEIEARKWGIKEFNIYIPDQTLNFIASKDDENGESMDIDMELIISNCQVEAEVNIGKGILSPQLLQIYKGKQVVEF